MHNVFFWLQKGKKRKWHQTLPLHTTFQFYIVTGGQKDQVDLHDSTEIFDVEAYAWAEVAAFPVQVAGLRLTNIMDKVLAFGKIMYMKCKCMD